MDDLVVLMKECEVKDGIAILDRPKQTGMFSVRKYAYFERKPMFWSS